MSGLLPGLKYLLTYPASKVEMTCLIAVNQVCILAFQNNEDVMAMVNHTGQWQVCEVTQLFSCSFNAALIKTDRHLALEKGAHQLYSFHAGAIISTHKWESHAVWP